MTEAPDQRDEKIEQLSAALRASDARVLKLERSNTALSKAYAMLAAKAEPTLSASEEALCVEVERGHAFSEVARMLVEIIRRYATAFEAHASVVIDNQSLAELAKLALDSAERAHQGTPARSALLTIGESLRAMVEK